MSSVRGFTLLEGLIACSVAVLLLVLVFQVVVPMGRGSLRGAQQVALQQEAATAVERLRRDLTGPPGGVEVFGADPLTVSIHRVQDVGADGSQVYSSELVLYRWDSSGQKLTRETWPPGPPSLSRVPDPARLFQPTSGEVDQILATTSGRERVLATRVREFTFVPGTAAEVHMLLEAPAPDNRPPERYRLDRVLWLQNSQY
ncbi:MAG: hypothetical protein AB1758_03110 [Candidatus Eremiobacterota bacterium]